jgi:hypothetical protein
MDSPQVIETVAKNCTAFSAVMRRLLDVPVKCKLLASWLYDDYNSVKKSLSKTLLAIALCLAKEPISVGAMIQGTSDAHDA